VGIVLHGPPTPLLCFKDVYAQARDHHHSPRPASRHPNSYPVRFKDFRITNVCGASTFGHGISLETLAADLRGVHRVSYDPEHHPWLKVKTAAMTLMLFRSGSVTVTGAPSAAAISAELTALQPLVWRHRL